MQRTLLYKFRFIALFTNSASSRTSAHTGVGIPLGFRNFWGLPRQFANWLAMTR